MRKCADDVQISYDLFLDGHACLNNSKWLWYILTMQSIYFLLLLWRFYNTACLIISTERVSSTLNLRQEKKKKKRKAQHFFWNSQKKYFPTNFDSSFSNRRWQKQMAAFHFLLNILPWTTQFNERVLQFICEGKLSFWRRNNKKFSLVFQPINFVCHL